MVRGLGGGCALRAGDGLDAVVVDFGEGPGEVRLRWLRVLGLALMEALVLFGLVARGDGLVGLLLLCGGAKVSSNICKGGVAGLRRRGKAGSE